MRRFELIAPVAVTRSPSGRTIVDFGQNLVGRLRITVRGKAGETITLRHAEILEHGELCTRPLRHAEATDRYTLRGHTVETWEPRFTFHGFRYAEVDGWPGDLEAGRGERAGGRELASSSEILAVVCHSDMERTGWFECSDPLVNRLHENAVWSMRGNFLDIPTDCPQRDERLGWTGDAQVFAPTACFLYDTAGFFQSWLADLAADQKAADGVVPVIIPNVMDTPPFPAAAWSDAAVVMPWVLYQRYGDVDMLAAQFESMRSWVDVVANVAGASRLWDRGFQFGDWLDPGAPPDRPAEARTPPYLVATAYFARSAELVGQAAAVLGRAEDAKRYLALAAEVRDAFAAEYITPAGRLLSDSATAYSLAIAFDLLPSANQRRHAGARLAELVRATGYHIGSGFVGTALICDALCSVGEYGAAYRLLMQRDCPSWLYPVTMGATTIWERWDSMRPDGSINVEGMTSFNHYAFGAVADWLHRTVGGLAPAEPGYRRMEMRPTPVPFANGYPTGGLTHARSRHRTPYGIAECAWAIKEGQIEVEVVVPPNTTAGVTLPCRDTGPIEVGSGTYRWSYPYEDPTGARKVLSPREKDKARLTIDNTLGEIIDDPEAWAATLVAIREQMPEYNGGELDPKGSVDMTVRRVFADYRNREQLLSAIQDALASREF